MAEDQRDPIEEFARTQKDDQAGLPPNLFDKDAMPSMVILGGGKNPFVPPEPPTLTDLAWAIVKSFAFFLIGIALSAALITWLWNANIADTAGEIDIHLVASALVIFRVLAFHWKGFRR